MKVFPAFWIHVRSPASSVAVQHKLFSLGYRWGRDERTIQYEDREVLWAELNGNICQSDLQHAVSGYEYVQQLTTEEFLTC